MTSGKFKKLPGNATAFKKTKDNYKMKRLKLTILLVWISVAAIAQGIRFERPSSWAAIIDKAKKDNKYILIDCYATWCVPCKKMDMEVLSNNEVGALVNDNFIAAKFQMDKTNKDSEIIRSLYKDAEMLIEKYAINSFPSLLFFSPSGELLFRSGSQNVSGFLSTVKTVLDSTKNVDGQIKSFENGQLQVQHVLELVATLKKIGRNDDAIRAAAYYKTNYLDKLSEDSLLNKSHLDFIDQYINLSSIRDKFFSLIYNNPDKVDNLLGKKRWSSDFVDYVIRFKEIEPRLWKNDVAITTDPDWKIISRTISSQFDKPRIERLIMDAKYDFYFKQKSWKKAAEAYIEKRKLVEIDTSDVMAIIGINQVSWNLYFLHIENRKMLRQAAEWMEITVKISPEKDINWAPHMDTYANLLYKSGRVKKAIEIETKVIAYIKASKQEEELDMRGYEETLMKMRKGERTW